MASTVLPDAASPTLDLVPATKEEITECEKLNFVEWGGPLNIAQYLGREEWLSNQELTRDGGITHWILIDTKDEKRTILCACESLRKKALVAYQGKLEDVTAHGVASVFCRQEFRGRGYASRMIKELTKKLRHWMQSDQKIATFAVLYSDVGKTFYANHGWKPFPSSHIELQPRVDESGHQAPGKPLTMTNLADYCREDESALRQRLRDESKVSQVARVALIPDLETMRWHHAREEYLAQQLTTRLPVKKGIVVGDKPGERVWCIWTRNFNEDTSQNTMYILRMFVEGAEKTNGSTQLDKSLANGQNTQSTKLNITRLRAIVAVLKAAQAEAFEWNMHKVELWNPSPIILLAAKQIDLNVKLIDREESSIASLKWYGNERGLGDAVEWLANEKYGWC